MFANSTWIFNCNYRHSIQIITVGMLHDRVSDAGEHPCLTLKGWNSRIFLAYMDHCLEEQLRRNAESGKHDPELVLAMNATRALLLWFCKQESAHVLYLTEQEAIDISMAADTYLEFAEALARFASQNGCVRWKILPKHHVLRLI